MIALFSFATPQQCADWCGNWCTVFKVVPEEMATEIVA
jgi:hypothetical protein